MVGNGKRMLRRGAVEAKTGIKKTKLYGMVAEGTFPAPVQLGSPGAVGWVESEVDEWLEQRIAERDQALAALPKQQEAA